MTWADAAFDITKLQLVECEYVLPSLYIGRWIWFCLHLLNVELQSLAYVNAYANFVQI